MRMLARSMTSVPREQDCWQKMVDIILFSRLYHLKFWGYHFGNIIEHTFSHKFNMYYLFNTPPPTRWVWATAWGEGSSCLPADQRQAGLYSAGWGAEEAKWGGSKSKDNFFIKTVGFKDQEMHWIYEISVSPLVGKECSCSWCAISPPWLWPSEGAVWGGAGGQGWAAAWNVQGQRWGGSVEEQVWNWCYPAHWRARGVQVSHTFKT